MKPSRLRPALCAGALAIGIATAPLAAAAVDVPLPEAGMPALESIVKSALAKSPRTMARDFDLLNAQYQEMVSASRLYPQVGGNYQFQVREEDQGPGLERHTIERSYYNLTVNQAIWHWGTVRAAARAGELGVMVAEHNLDAVRRALALEVRTSYMALILQKMALRNARFSEGRLRDALAVQEARFKAEEITAGAIHDIRLRTDETGLATARAASDLEFAIRAFRRLSGVDSFTEADIPDAIAPPPAGPAPTDPRADTGYLRSAALLANELQIEQGKLNYQINRKALWPKLNAIGGVSQDDNLYSSTLDRRISNVAIFIGVHVQWAVFDGFASKGRRLQSLNSVRQLERTREDLLASLVESADQQAVQVGFAWSAYTHSRQRNQWATGRVSYEKANLARGQSSEEQIANAQASLNQAELAASDALAKFYTAAARYASTMQADPIIDGKKEN